MCEQSLLEDVLKNVKNHDVKWIKGGNHALKTKGSKEETVMSEIGDLICDWCKTVLAGTGT